MTELVLGAAFGCALLSAGFLAGWKFRDAAGVSSGEMPVILDRRGGSRVLDDWETGDEE
jgi:hypothetical protein